MNFDAHVAAWIEYREAMDWNAECEQMMRAEGEWEDNGCRPLPGGLWGQS